MVKKGFKACWLASNPGLKYVHTTKDTMDLVSKKGLKDGLDLTLEVVGKISKEIQ
jgi:hypothetical protein